MMRLPSAAAIRIFLSCAPGLAFAAVAAAQPAVTRADFTIPGAPGVQLFVREVLPSRAPDPRLPPVLLVHGTPVPSLASFDLQVEGGSLAADLANAGLRVYLMDVRGYGRSTRPARMNEPPVPGVALTRESEALEDLGSMVDWVRTRARASSVALVGWGAGGQWAGVYASRFPGKVSALVLYGTMYGGGANHPAFGRGSELEDPQRPGRFAAATLGAYRLVDGPSLLRPWDASIPDRDKAAWRDPRVAAAFVKEALASDPTSATRTPAALRAPAGPLADVFEVASGRLTWDAGLVQCRTLVIAGERDFWSRPEDRDRLRAHLLNAPGSEVATIKGGTHFVHLDRPARGRDEFLKTVTSFLLRPGT
jgi:pimeloyl-ACP methyl ester carboxylesterase